MEIFFIVNSCDDWFDWFDLNELGRYSSYALSKIFLTKWLLHLKAVEHQEYNDALTLESSSMSSLKDYLRQNSLIDSCYCCRNVNLILINLSFLAYSVSYWGVINIYVNLGSFESQTVIICIFRMMLLHSDLKLKLTPGMTNKDN